MTPRTANKKTGRTPARKGAKKRARRSFVSFITTNRVTGPVIASRRVRRLAAAGTASVFLFSVFSVPVRAYVNQRRSLSHLEKEFESYADANEALQTEVNRLQTPEGALGAARDQLGYVRPGEKRVRLLPSPKLPTNLPGEWPYTLVSGIVAVRADIADHGNNPLSPLTP